MMKPRIEYDEKGRRVHTLSIPAANRFALLLIIPIALIMALPYFLIWGENAFLALKFKSYIFLILFVLLGIVVHEVLHAAVWVIFAGKGFRSIRLGMKWEYLTPYCHCTEALKVWQYIAGGLTPLAIMGIFPAIWAMVTGNTLIMFFGIFYTWTAAGDILSVWMLRNFRADQIVYDHPEELGFILEEETND